MDFESTKEGVCTQSTVTCLRTLLSTLVPLLPCYYFIRVLISPPQPTLPFLSPFGKYVTPVRRPELNSRPRRVSQSAVCFRAPGFTCGLCCSCKIRVLTPVLCCVVLVSRFKQCNISEPLWKGLMFYKCQVVVLFSLPTLPSPA